MKKKALASVKPEEIDGKIAELRKSLVKYYAQRTTGNNSKVPGEIRTAKKTIAQLKTLQQRTK